MKCHRCKKDNDTVIKTWDKGDSIKRKRKCICGFRFVTRERYAEEKKGNGIHTGGLFGEILSVKT